MNRAQHLKAKYGISLDDYAIMLENQDGRCAICGTEDPGNSTYFHVDHDHDCCPSRYTCGQCIRGLLCHGCNNGIGRFMDNAQALRAAAAYITRNKRKRLRACLK